MKSFVDYSQCAIIMLHVSLPLYIQCSSIFDYNTIYSARHYHVLYLCNFLSVDIFFFIKCNAVYYSSFILFSLPRPYFPIVLSIEKIEKNTDIKFPKETEDNKQQLQAHFMLPQGALKNITGIPHV